MTFKGIDNQTVELKIVNYEFSNNKNGDCYDNNWLNVFIKVDSKVGKWQTIDPSLLTGEVMELITWFSYLSENREYTLMEFIEPNLSFELVSKYDSEIKRIRIYFNLESRPQSATDDRKYFVDCEWNKNDLKQIVVDLNKEMEKYQER